MDADVKRQWCEALESGKYTQGKGALCNLDRNYQNPTYCCLGILCDVMKIPYYINKTVGLQKRTYILEGIEEANDLPVGSFDLSYAQIHVLAKMNDDEQLSFMEISQWIKDNL